MPARTLLDDRPAHSRPWAEDVHAVLVAGASKAVWVDGGLPPRDDNSRRHASDLPASLPPSLVVAGWEGTLVFHVEDWADHEEARLFGQVEMPAGDDDHLACLDSHRWQGFYAL